MAVTGIVFGLFVLMDMIGNPKAYLGPQHFDDYAMWLRHLAEPLVPYSGMLWALRVVLLACLVALLVPLGSPAIFGRWSHVLFSDRSSQRDCRRYSRCSAATGRKPAASRREARGRAPARLTRLYPLSGRP